MSDKKYINYLQFTANLYHILSSSNHYMFVYILFEVLGLSRNLVSTFYLTPQFTVAIRASGFGFQLQLSNGNKGLYDKKHAFPAYLID